MLFPTAVVELIEYENKIRAIPCYPLNLYLIKEISKGYHTIGAKKPCLNKFSINEKTFYSNEL
jgi:hypothetical protein